MVDPNVHHETDGDSVLRRDRGLRRVSTGTRWTVAAAAAGTAALGLTYTHLLPGTSPATAAAQGVQQNSANCVLQPSAVAPAPPAAQAAHREKDDEGENAADDEGSRNASTVTTAQPPTTVCLTPPAQPPAPGQQAPQTRTGAS